MNNPADKNNSNWVSSEIIYHILIIIMVSVFAYGLFYVSAIYSDDWNHVIERPVTNNAKFLDITDRRPLLFTPFLFQNQIFGVNVPAYYLILFSLIIIDTLLVYLIVNRFEILRRHNLSLVVALLFLVYPTNYTHMWLTMLATYVSVSLTLLYAYFLLGFAKGGRTFVLFTALIFMLLSFGIYEAQMGLISVWPIILLITHRQLPTARRISLIIPIIFAGVFMLWRIYGQQTIGVPDSYLSQISLAPEVLLSRLRLGYMISFFWGWATSVRWYLPWLTDNKYAIFSLILFIFLWLGIFRLIISCKRTQTNQAQNWPLSKRWPEIRMFSVVSLFGLILIGAGYIPIISVVLPNLTGNGASSRVNLYASIGSALFVSCMLMIGTILIAKNRRQVDYLFIASVIPIMLIGIMTQASVQKENKTAWREQQAIWQALFLCAPNLKNDTHVLLILPGFQDRVGYQNWKRSPLYAFWDITSGLRILYDNPTLSGDIIFPDIDTEVEPTITLNGIVNQESKALTPFERSVVLIYNNNTRTIAQIKEFPPEIIDGNEDSITFCADCILNGVPSVPLRRLIQD